MKAIKCYNAYVSNNIRTLTYIVYPILVLLASIMITGLKENVPGVMGLLILVPATTVLINFYVDRITIGPIYSNWGKDEEVMKTSESGMGIFENVMIGDFIARTLLGLGVMAEVLLVILISGKYSGYSEKLFPSALISVLAVHAVSGLMVNVERTIESMNEAMLIMYAIEFVFVPAIIAVVIGKPAFIYITCIPYVIIDVLTIFISNRKIHSLVSDKWFRDQ